MSPMIHRRSSRRWLVQGIWALVVLLLPGTQTLAANDPGRGGCLSVWVSSSPGDFTTLHAAVSHINSFGCTSGGLNEILIDFVTHPVISFSSPIPTVARPTYIGTPPDLTNVPRVILRANNNTQLTGTAALIASNRVVIQNLDIQGQAARDFGAGILLTGGADGSRIRGVRVSRARIAGISISNVSDINVERSADFPTVVVDSGFGTASNPLYGPGISINGSLNVRVDGARLGIDDDGSLAGNCSYGITISDSVLVNLGAAVTNLERRNVIGDNQYGGIYVVDSDVVNIHGNYIGLAPNNLTPAGNGTGGTCLGSGELLSRGGVVVRDSSFVAIGTNLPAHGSHIVANATGINLINAQSISVRRNQIGRRPNLSTLANLNSAIVVSGNSGQSDSTPVQIGSASNTDDRNVIVGDGSSNHGIRIFATVGRVEILSNAIYGHGQNPIDRAIPPFPPVLTLADAGSGQVAGTLTPDPNPGRVDIFADVPGESQARYFLGSVAVAANASSFATTISDPNFLLGRPITATFTADSGPGTSVFSQPRIAAPAEDSVFADGFEADGSP